MCIRRGCADFFSHSSSAQRSISVEAVNLCITTAPKPIRSAATCNVGNYLRDTSNVATCTLVNDLGDTNRVATCNVVNDHRDLSSVATRNVVKDPRDLSNMAIYHVHSCTKYKER